MFYTTNIALMNLLWLMEADLDNVFIQKRKTDIVLEDWITKKISFLHSRNLSSLDSIWDILQELAYECQCEPYENIRELDKAIRQKLNKIDDKTTKKALCSEKSI